ncbi:polysaccharide deacetylase family protein [Anaeroselena agilis]|uniref:Polysaccharide deacetylase family protein n=1 Tax=Anaeroselena agilis TaxID=3063788 RepID=A0ABU3NX23_9FIRM|nr:polysaccharide deacetylase family protein [Selenomonadales bacterium 4137-cl]
MRLFYAGRVPRWYLGFVAGFLILAGLLPGLAELIAADQNVPRPIYNGHPGKQQVALACNIFWGEEYLPTMLDALDRGGVKVTFFIGGSWAKRHPDLVRELAARGHELANHSYSHPHPNTLSVEQNQDQILRTEKLVEELTGVKTKLYAPPYGEFNAAVLKAAAGVGYTTILWSVDTVDWKRPPAETILNRVLGKVHNGAIILMHPTEPTAQALPELIFRLQARGYAIKPVSDILN